MSASERLRILVVEDEIIVAVDLSELLTEFGHDVCAIARTAEEAVLAARRFHPDIVLTDIRLAEGSSGIDAAQQIRAEFGIPSFFISGSIDRGVIEQTRASAPLGFFTKPFQPGALRAALTRAFSDAQTTTG